MTVIYPQWNNKIFPARKLLQAVGHFIYVSGDAYASIELPERGE